LGHPRRGGVLVHGGGKKVEWRLLGFIVEEGRGGGESKGADSPANRKEILNFQNLTRNFSP